MPLTASKTDQMVHDQGIAKDSVLSKQSRLSTILYTVNSRASTFSLSCLLGSEVIDGDEQVAVDSAHFQRAAELLQSQRGLSALSLEEQKLLHSLDRLNHRLQCKLHLLSSELVRTGITYKYILHAVLSYIQSSTAKLIIR